MRADDDYEKYANFCVTTLVYRKDRKFSALFELNFENGNSLISGFLIENSIWRRINERLLEVFDNLKSETDRTER